MMMLLSVSRKRLLWKHIGIFFYFFNFWSLKRKNSCCGCWQNDAFWLGEFSMHLSQSWSLTGHIKCQVAVIHTIVSSSSDLFFVFVTHCCGRNLYFWNSTKSGWKTWHVKCKKQVMRSKDLPPELTGSYGGHRSGAASTKKTKKTRCCSEGCLELSDLRGRMAPMTLKRLSKFSRSHVRKAERSGRSLQSRQMPLNQKTVKKQDAVSAIRKNGPFWHSF